MRSFLLFFMTYALFAFELKSQNCSGGGAPVMVTWNLNGLLAVGVDGTTGNSTGTICFPGGAQLAVVGDSWTGVTITTSNGSYCSEAAIQVGNPAGSPAGWDYTFFSANNTGPCGTATFALENYNDPGGSSVFNTNASGCMTFEIYDTFNDTGTDFTFTGGSITFYGCPVGQVLPIEIKNITAINKGEYNNITWTTTSEINNDVQMVERSKDGRSGWEMVGKVAGTNKSQEVTYEVIDENPLNISYYRLHSIDFDGREQFSKIVSVRRDGIKGGRINAIYPNPATHQLTADLQSDTDGDAVITISDITGKVMTTSKIYLKEGINNHQSDLTSLPSGMYILKVEGAGINEFKKFVKE